MTIHKFDNQLLKEHCCAAVSELLLLSGYGCDGIYNGKPLCVEYIDDWNHTGEVTEGQPKLRKIGC